MYAEVASVSKSSGVSWQNRPYRCIVVNLELCLSIDVMHVRIKIKSLNVKKHGR